ncbi:hypothetical protein FJT64_024508 [Amphibalanus amphitrite]|uniref:ZSWIM1/3 RNaseH-like domain-containing protein n=1 Tax=Amphibalanus amphitrite TaxID=1232801 RepID=A0A6A4WMY3_AMPAM|nr:hypothetical protein FJT64_024508 [Amphibalanus amphitrite]
MLFAACLNGYFVFCTSFPESRHNDVQHGGRRAFAQALAEQFTRDQVEMLERHGFSTSVVQDEFAGVVCGIFFQDEEMRRTFREFPDLLLLDATYKMIDNRAPVFTILGVDSMGLGVPLAVFIVTEETAAMIGSMLEIFKQKNVDAASQTKGPGGCKQRRRRNSRPRQLFSPDQRHGSMERGAGTGIVLRLQPGSCGSTPDIS